MDSIQNRSDSAKSLRAPVAVIGAGYVGLTTAVCLAHLGHRVVSVDVDAKRVKLLSSGQSPILEEGLDDLLRAGISSGLLSFTTDPRRAVRGSHFVFLCVPTPMGADGAADLRFVEQASADIAPHLEPGTIVVTKSTVPVGSAGKVIAALGRPDTTVVSNPEFLREGAAIHDWLHPDRVVIGSEDRRAGERLAELYKPLGAPTIITDPASSEMIKYACNAFLASKLSFINAIASLCSAVGANAVEVIRGMSYDTRIGADHLTPGPGWGGSCFPKDTQALVRISEDHGYDFALLREVIASNETQFSDVADLVEEAAGGLDGAVVAAWGLTFKAHTDDLRDSPAIAVLRRVAERGATIQAFDPTRPDPRNVHLQGLDLDITEDPYAACNGAHVLVVLTEWPEFQQCRLDRVAAAMVRPAMVDTRNLFEPSDARRAGLSYTGMGRS